jgi:hypothetical protein
MLRWQYLAEYGTKLSTVLPSNSYHVTASKAESTETSVLSFIYKEIFVCAAFPLSAVLSALRLMLCFTAVFGNKTELQSIAASSTLDVRNCLSSRYSYVLPLILYTVYRSLL